MERHSGWLVAPLLLLTMLTAADATGIVFMLTNMTSDLHGNATESFWISSSYLLAMSISQLAIAHVAACCASKSLLLWSVLALGTGSLLVDFADQMILCLLGRGIQGLGAGGAVVLACILGGDGIALPLAMAVGTVGGPFVGAAFAHSDAWRWYFRVTTLLCIPIGVAIFNSRIYTSSDHVSLKSVDCVGTALLLGALIPLLSGLSLGGIVYHWTDWRALTTFVIGAMCLLLFVAAYVFPATRRQLSVGRGLRTRPLLDRERLRFSHSGIVWLGSMALGVLLSVLVFFLPTYYRVVKRQSRLMTAVLLLPQTSMLFPCGIVTARLWQRQSARIWIVVAGWFLISAGVALLTLLSVDKSVPSDVLLNLLSGIGVSILHAAMTLRVRSEGHIDVFGLHLCLRNLGSATGVVVHSIYFQHALENHLQKTDLRNEAAEIASNAGAMAGIIRDFKDSSRAVALIHALDSTLHDIWVELAVGCSSVLFLTLALAMFSGADTQSTMITTNKSSCSSITSGTESDKVDKEVN